MSEAVTEGTPGTAPVIPETQSGTQLEGQQTGTGNQPEEIDYKAETDRLREELKKARKFEDQVKAMRPKVQQFEQLQQATMTAEERMQAQLETAATEREAARVEAETTKRELAVMKAAVKHGLTSDDLEFLEGVPADKVEATAAKLAKRLGSSAIPNPDGGSRTPPPTTSDMGEFLRQSIQNARGRR